jgi:hypothetical protein
MRKLTLEKENVENPTVGWAKKNGCELVYKMSTQFTRDWPDRLFFIPGGRPLLIEFKRPGKAPTPKQAARIKQLKELGYDVEVCDNKEQGVALVRARLEAAAVHAPRRKVPTGARRRSSVP